MMAFLHNAPFYILPFILVLGLVVTVHELGHFLVARWLGVAVDRFSIGFGRALFSWKDKAGVEWRLGWIPLGGYVRFAGDAEASSSVPDGDSLERQRREIVAREGVGAERRYFHFKPVWARALVVAAGPLANFVLAVVIFTLILATFGESIIRPRIGKVEPNSAAAAAGFQAGDLIKSLDGHPIADYSELKRYVVVRAEQPIRVEFERDGKILEVVATPRRQSETNALIGGSSKVGMLGLGSSTQRQDYFIRRYNPIEAMGHGVVKTYDILGTTLTYLGRLVRGLESGDQLGGPLRTAAISGAVAKAGVDAGNGLGTQILGMGLNLLNLAGVLSVGIGFMNLLPVPVLDGGHLLFYAYEAAARRPLGAQVQAAGYRVGLALLLGLMLFATWNDLQQLRVFKILGGLFS